MVPKSELLETAESRMKDLLKFPDSGRAATKQYFRADFCRDWEQFAEQEPAGAWKILSSPPLIKTLDKYMAGLAGKKKSKL